MCMESNHISISLSEETSVNDILGKSQLGPKMGKGNDKLLIKSITTQVRLPLHIRKRHSQRIL